MEKPHQNNFDQRKIVYFYEDFSLRNPFYVAFLVIITAGFYGVNFIYDLNKKFEKYDSNAPDSKRGLFVILFLPSFVGYLTFIHQYLFEGDLSSFLVLQILLGALLVFLILKYIYDFCEIFAEFTQSNTLFWFSNFFPAYLAIILFTMKYYYTGLFFLSLSLFVFSSMQSELNKRFWEYRSYRGKLSFNSMDRINS